MKPIRLTLRNRPTSPPHTHTSMITRPEPNSSEEGLLFLLLENYDSLLEAADNDTSDEAEETLIAKRADLVNEYAKKLVEMVVLSHEVRKLAAEEDETDVAESGGKCKCNGDCVPLTQLDDLMRKQGYVKAGTDAKAATEADDDAPGYTPTANDCDADDRNLTHAFQTGYSTGYDEGYEHAEADAKKKHIQMVFGALAGVTLMPIVEQAAEGLSEILRGAVKQPGMADILATLIGFATQATKPPLTPAQDEAQAVAASASAYGSETPKQEPCKG